MLKRLFSLFFLSFVICHLLVPSAHCASLFDEEARVSKEVQERLQKELENVFGKNKARVLVSVELAIDPEIRAAIKNAIVNSFNPNSKPKEIDGTKMEFLW